MNMTANFSRFFVRWVALVAITLGLGACSPESKESKPSPTPATTPAPEPTSTPAPTKPDATPKPAAETKTGTVKITARYQGAERPKRIVLNMAGNPDCVLANNNQQVGNVNLLVNKDMTVRNVICYVKEQQTGMDFPVPTEKALLDQKGCMYDPHVQTVMTNHTLTVRNSDATLHNIHSFAEKQKSVNFAQPQKGDERDIEFKRAEFVKVKCDVHPWMSAFVGVFEHPYHAVTGNDGTCVIELPVGEYTIGGWHEENADLEAVSVTVTEGEQVEADIKVPG